MRLAQLELHGFRGIQKGVISFPRHCVLLGPNDVGKTTIAEALALLSGKDRLTRPICDWDFYGGAPDAASRFKLVATLTEFGDGSTEDPSAFPDWFMGERSARSVWWHESDSTVSTEADAPAGTRLAAQIALSGRYVDEASEFEMIRYFYDGDTDPFSEDHRSVPTDRLRELGIFLLPSNRDSERVLAFGSSSFLKMLREYGGVPGKAIEALKQELRKPSTLIEDAIGLKDVLERAEDEIKSFLLMKEASRLVYRATSLDVLSVLRSLIPHIMRETGFLLPVARHGSGMASLHLFTVLLAFAQFRLQAGQNFMFVAEEPELHLHPSLHRRLVSRIRASSSQSLVTTHSPAVASHYAPTDVLYLRNDAGQLVVEPLRREPISSASIKAVRKLYLTHRHEFYDALMAGALVVPEGISDHDWLSLWLRIAEASAAVAQDLKLSPVAFVPTHDGAVADTYEETRRFRPDAVPLVDGDDQGEKYIEALGALKPPPRAVARYGASAAVEYLAAWILEPCLAAPGRTLSDLLQGTGGTLRDLQVVLTGKARGEPSLREALAWEALDTPDAVKRAGEFLQDIALIAAGQKPSNEGWACTTGPSGVTVYTATHIRKSV
jgi:putative ATP-dependent endonuclease of OLD family